MADEMTNNTTTNEATDEQSTSTETKETKSYTQDEVMEMIQREADRRVSDALKKQEKKFNKQLSLSKLDGDERERAEKDDRIAELEQQLAEFKIERNKSELKSTLASRGLDAQFADMLNIGDDTEVNQKLISDFDKMFKRAVNAEVEKRINGNNAKSGAKTDNSAMTVEKFNKMTIAEQSKYLMNNPEFKETLMNKF